MGFGICGHFCYLWVFSLKHALCGLRVYAICTVCVMYVVMTRSFSKNNSIKVLSDNIKKCGQVPRILHKSPVTIFVDGMATDTSHHKFIVLKSCQVVLFNRQHKIMKCILLLLNMDICVYYTHLCNRSMLIVLGKEKVLLRTNMGGMKFK